MEQVLPPPSTLKVFLSFSFHSNYVISLFTVLHKFSYIFFAHSYALSHTYILLNVTKTYAEHFTDMTSLAWLNMHMLVWF